MESNEKKLVIRSIFLDETKLVGDFKTVIDYLTEIYNLYKDKEDLEINSYWDNDGEVYIYEVTYFELETDREYELRMNKEKIREEQKKLNEPIKLELKKIDNQIEMLNNKRRELFKSLKWPFYEDV